jgi:hypothetical protein
LCQSDQVDYSAIHGRWPIFDCDDYDDDWDSHGMGMGGGCDGSGIKSEKSGSSPIASSA